MRLNRPLQNSIPQTVLFILFLGLGGCQTVPKPTGEIGDLPAQKRRSLPADAVSLDSTFFVTLYSRNRNIAYYSQYVLRAENLRKPQIKRKDLFRADSRLKEKARTVVQPTWYANTGFDRGHLAPSGDFTWDRTANEATFFMTNIVPQRPSLNRVAWKALESKVRGWACREGTVRIVTGPILHDGLDSLEGYPVPVPKKFFKAVVDETPPKKGIAFIMSQDDSRADTYKSSVVTIREVERQTQLDLLSDEDPSDVSVIGDQSNLNEWVEEDCTHQRRR